MFFIALSTIASLIWLIVPDGGLLRHLDDWSIERGGIETTGTVVEIWETSGKYRGTATYTTHARVRYVDRDGQRHEAVTVGVNAGVGQGLPVRYAASRPGRAVVLDRANERDDRYYLIGLALYTLFMLPPGTCAALAVRRLLRSRRTGN